MEFRTEADDYEAQHNDQLQTEFRLEEIFFALENGQPLDNEELALLRYSCGMPKKPYVSPLKDIFDDFANIFGKGK